ncbi:ThuA domain-containing protein [Paenibacillus thailandensis]|uniref:ThuA domain-containing protein n=1 Tax=Paenibacillus thailandensis TaxID=393250 RepID=A0ABW5R5L8_9BACL
MNERKVLLIGDNGGDVWHPLDPIRRQLADIVGDLAPFVVTEDYDSLKKLTNDEYDAVISYTDCWRKEVTPEQTAGLLAFVAGGGGLLALHNGISLQSSYELAQMVGGKFVSHPPYQPLSYHGTNPSHPLLHGVEDFTMNEEPYVIELDPFAPVNIFLEYQYEGRRYPAGWERRYGLGKVVYLQPGHDARSFAPESYRQLIRNSLAWVANGA